MKNIFTKHPNGIGESYLQHLIKGIIFSFKLVPIAVKIFIHAFSLFYLRIVQVTENSRVK